MTRTRRTKQRQLNRSALPTKPKIIESLTARHSERARAIAYAAALEILG